MIILVQTTAVYRRLNTMPPPIGTKGPEIFSQLLKQYLPHLRTATSVPSANHACAVFSVHIPKSSPRLQDPPGQNNITAFIGLSDHDRPRHVNVARNRVSPSPVSRYMSVGQGLTDSATNSPSGSILPGLVFVNNPWHMGPLTPRKSRSPVAFQGAGSRFRWQQDSGHMMLHT